MLCSEILSNAKSSNRFEPEAIAVKEIPQKRRGRESGSSSDRAPRALLSASSVARF